MEDMKIQDVILWYTSELLGLDKSTLINDAYICHSIMTIIKEEIGSTDRLRDRVNEAMEEFNEEGDEWSRLSDAYIHAFTSVISEIASRKFDLDLSSFEGVYVRLDNCVINLDYNKLINNLPEGFKAVKSLCNHLSSFIDRYNALKVPHVNAEVSL